MRVLWPWGSPSCKSPGGTSGKLSASSKHPEPCCKQSQPQLCVDFCPNCSFLAIIFLHGVFPPAHIRFTVEKLRHGAAAAGRTQVCSSLGKSGASLREPGPGCQKDKCKEVLCLFFFLAMLLEMHLAADVLLWPCLLEDGGV